MTRIDLSRRSSRRLLAALARLLIAQLRATVRRPWRLLKLYRLVPCLESCLNELLGETARWRPHPIFPGLYVRVQSWRAYRYIQRLKIRHISAEPHFSRYRRELRELLSTLPGFVDCQERVALCLATRHGAEVAAFRDLEAFAVGIDIAPPVNSPYSLYGDFHDLSNWPPNSADVIFCNSLDHVRHLGQWAGQVETVLHPSGHLIVQVPNGRLDDPPHQPGHSESLWWDRWQNIALALQMLGFAPIDQIGIAYPFPGITLVFGKEKVQ